MITRQEILNIIDDYAKKRKNSFFSLINKNKLDIIQKATNLICNYIDENGSINFGRNPLNLLTDLFILIDLDKNEDSFGKNLNLTLNKVVSSICQNINFSDLNNLLIDTINKLGSLGEYKYSYSIALNILNTLTQKQKSTKDAEIEMGNYNILKVMNKKFDRYYKYTHKGMTWLENFSYYMAVSLLLIIHIKKHFVFCNNLMNHELTMLTQNIETLVNYLQNNETPVDIEFRLITELSEFIITFKALIEENFKTELFDKTNSLINTYNKFLTQKKLSYEFDWVSNLPFPDKIKISPDSYPLALMKYN